jgi:hypothetical protein
MFAFARIAFFVVECDHWGAVERQTEPVMKCAWFKWMVLLAGGFHFFFLEGCFKDLYWTFGPLV